MNTYNIGVQFKKTAIFDQDAMEGIKKAVEYYNSVSFLARNRKKIDCYELSEDRLTLHIKLLSDEALPMPTKALRTLSVNLVEKQGFGRFLCSKQLFRMFLDDDASPFKPLGEVFQGEGEILLTQGEFELLGIEEKLNIIYRLLSGGAGK